MEVQWRPCCERLFSSQRGLRESKGLTPATRSDCSVIGDDAMTPSDEAGIYVLISGGDLFKAFWPDRAGVISSTSRLWMKQATHN